MVQGFVHRRAGHCGSGALRDLLEHRGLDYGGGPLSEGAVFGLAGGLGAFFFGGEGLLYIVGRTGELERDVAGNLDAGLEVRDTDDPDEGWAWVKAEVDAGRPPMVWADIAELEYLRVRMSNTRHDILVVGYDEGDGIAWIADNDRDELQRCSLSSLAAARNSQGFPGPNHHRTFIYTWPERLPDPEIAARRGLRRSIANMRTRPDSAGKAPGAVGLDAIDAFAAAYPELRDEAALATLSVLIVKAGTGGAMFRSLHATFLREFGIDAAADVYEELADTWVELARHARAGEHAAGAPLAERIRELEHAGVAAMEAAV
jgi:butirosin biosynthesis protein H-like/uncharacterized protein DUF4872